MTDYKKDFPLLAGSDIAYLDNAATAQRPEAVLKAVEDFYTKKNANPLRGLYELGIEATEAYEAARERVREFINAGKTSEHREPEFDRVQLWFNQSESRR